MAVTLVWLLESSHEYVKGALPPVCIAVNSPSLAPLQLTFETLMFCTSKRSGSSTKIESVSIQPKESTTVTK